MKFKDVRTVESILVEYGMKQGASTPTSQQQTGATAKANAQPKSPTTSNSPKQPDQGSPTVGDKNAPEPIEPQQQSAKDLEKDSVVVGKDNQNKTVVSPVGDGDIPDAMVVQGDDGEYEVIDQNKKVNALSPDDAKSVSTLNKAKGSFGSGSAAVNKLASLGSIELPKNKQQVYASKKIKAKNLEDGAEYKNQKGELQGTVISRVGRKPNTDKVVVMDSKGEYNIVDPNQEVHILSLIHI